MTTIERLRETLGAGMPDGCTIDGTTYENNLPLTHGDARKLLALYDAIKAKDAPVGQTLLCGDISALLSHNAARQKGYEAALAALDQEGT